MIDEKTELDIIAIVPARGGSKRLPRKNILPLAGKPLIQWTLDAAKASGVFDLIIVTSDDDEVISIAQSEQVMTIRRPNELANDTATTIDTIIHALDYLGIQGITAKRMMLLQPTSPLRNAGHIRAAVEKMERAEADSVISVCEMDHSPLWCNTLDEDGGMNDFLSPEILGRRSQDLSDYYRLNGAIYFSKSEKFRSRKSFFMEKAYALIMSKEMSVDIDDRLDFLWAEFLLGNNKNN